MIVDFMMIWYDACTVQNLQRFIPLLIPVLQEFPASSGWVSSTDVRDLLPRVFCGISGIPLNAVNDRSVQPQTHSFRV